MKSKIIPAYLDKAERGRPGEVWRDVPGYDGYRVSNLGRVRSIDREVFHSRCGTQFVRGRILSQNVKKHYNRYTKDYVVILQTTFMQENNRFDVIVRRLVYAAFKDPRILTDSKRMIIAKDGDGYNNRLENLRAVNNSERMKLVVLRKRMSMTIAKLDHTKFKPTFNLWKPVHRCNLKGKILETYPCIAHAARKEGYYHKGIIDAAKEKQRTYKGFKWRYASRKVLEPIKRTWDNRLLTS